MVMDTGRTHSAGHRLLRRFAVSAAALNARTGWLIQELVVYLFAFPSDLGVPAFGCIESWQVVTRPYETERRRQRCGSQARSDRESMFILIVNA